MLAIEQRYYGESLTPEMLQKEHLAYLTSQQMLADVEAIQNKVQQDYNVSNTTKRIVFGYSFGGFHAVYYRVKYPHMVDGAFASSAGVGAEYDGYKYWSNIGYGLKNTSLGGSDACFQAVSRAFGELDQNLQKSNWTQLARDFGLCEVPQSPSDKDRFAVAVSISMGIGTLAYTMNISPGMNYKDFLCPMFVNASNPYEGLQEYQEFSMSMQGHNCSASTWAGYLADKKLYENGIPNFNQYLKNSGQRALWREVCGHFGYIFWCDRSRECPLSSYLSQDGYQEMCREVYGIPPFEMSYQNERILAFYGAQKPNSSHILVSNGVADPWFPYGIQLADPAREIYVVNIEEMGHTADSEPRKTDEPKSLTSARDLELEILAKWIKAN